MPSLLGYREKNFKESSEEDGCFFTASHLTKNNCNCRPEKPFQAFTFNFKSRHVYNIWRFRHEKFCCICDRGLKCSTHLIAIPKVSTTEPCKRRDVQPLVGIYKYEIALLLYSIYYPIASLHIVTAILLIASKCDLLSVCLLHALFSEMVIPADMKFNRQDGTP